MTDPSAFPWSRRRFLGGAASLAALGAFATACQSANTPSSDTGANPPATPYASGSAPGAEADAELISRRYPGLRPFAPAPAAPGTKPIALSAAHPQVFARVPITDKVVFVTIDDGIEKDPAFIQMVKDFQVPLTLSLADTLIRDDYAYFAKLYATGYVSIQNHTLTHPLHMPNLSPARQLEEIAGQQDKLRREYGTTPYLFRPPGGNWDEATVGAVHEAGLKGMMLWKEAMEIRDMQYQTPVHRLCPGDIILCHFRGPAQLKGRTMVQMMTNLYRHIQAQGFTVGDITAYV